MYRQGRGCSCRSSPPPCGGFSFHVLFSSTSHAVIFQHLFSPSQSSEVGLFGGFCFSPRAHSSRLLSYLRFQTVFVPVAVRAPRVGLHSFPSTGTDITPDIPRPLLTKSLSRDFSSCSFCPVSCPTSIVAPFQATPRHRNRYRRNWSFQSNGDDEVTATKKTRKRTQ